MAADNEVRLISKVIRDRDLGYLLERGVKDDWFFVEENQQIWKFIRNHFSKYGEVPTAVTLLDNYPTYRLLKVDDSVSYLLDQLIAYRNRQTLIDTVQAAGSSIKEVADNDVITEILTSGIHKVALTGGSESHDVNLSSNTEQRLEDYRNIKLRPNGLIGMASGFNTIDLATGGLQGGQLVTIIAPPKTGKSVLALQVAANLHEDGFVPMFQSFEMTNIEQQHRYDSMRAHIAQSRLIRGALNPDEEERYEAWLKRNSEMHPFLLTDSVQAMNLTSLIAKVEKHRPDALFVDGVYLMEDEEASRGETRRGSPSNLQHITQGMKRIAQKYNIPVIQTTQVLTSKMTKGRVTSSAIGYSSSFEQDSDVVLALQRQDEEDDSSRILRIDRSRNSGPAEAELLWDWENGRFEEYGNPFAV